MTPLGHQLLLDLSGIEADRLDDISSLRQLLVAAARDGGATVVEERFHRFAPHGVSGVVILAESHLAVHTWPELGTAAIDIFTCGDASLTERIGESVLAALDPQAVRRQAVERGAPASPRRAFSLEQEGAA
ncbi:MAG: adenosylmethionine decarboxylase [Acidobacteriota bacterium]